MTFWEFLRDLFMRFDLSDLAALIIGGGGFWGAARARTFYVRRKLGNGNGAGDAERRNGHHAEIAQALQRLVQLQEHTVDVARKTHYMNASHYRATLAKLPDGEARKFPGPDSFTLPPTPKL